jgi:sugar phosphate isomerase/epimerase
MSAGAPLDLGIVSDEVALPFREAVRHAAGWGITRFEIRCLVSGRVPALDRAEWNELVSLTGDQGLTITALSPGVFKHPLSRKADIEKELSDVLPKTIDLAHECGARLIIVFGFAREQGEQAGNDQAAVAVLRRAAELASRNGVTLAVENEPGFHCDTGANTRTIIEHVGSAALGANWDPCNAYGTAEIPYPQGYEAVKPVIVNVHAKDTTRGSLIQCVPIGEGVIDWGGQVQALMRDGMVRHITIETHCLPLVEQSRKNVAVLRALMRRPSIANLSPE